MWIAHGECGGVNGGVGGEKGRGGVGTGGEGKGRGAKPADSPVLLLSQLSRDSENEKDTFKLLRYLRESGEIEQAADAVMFLSGFTPKQVAEFRTKRPEVRISEVPLWYTLGKNRNGPTGAYGLIFDTRRQTFRPTKETVDEIEYEQENLF